MRFVKKKQQSSVPFLHFYSPLSGSAFERKHYTYLVWGTVRRLPAVESESGLRPLSLPVRLHVYALQGPHRPVTGGL